MKTLFVLCFSLVLLCRYTEGKKGVQNAMVYLSKYGYLEANQMGNSSYLNAKTFKKSLREFQAFAGIPVTGKMDNKTMEMMTMPRCGMKDNIGQSRKSASFRLQGSKWRQRNLKYKITKYPARLDRRSVDQTIQKAFNIWAKYVSLTFEPTTGRQNIDIRFERRSHGDGDAFDGQGGTLAHAFFPQFGGTTHFDDDETWVVNGGRGTDLLQVATHEFGHALGLSHSEIKEALMAPFYKGYIANLDLWADDINGIQRIYGKKTGAPTPAPGQPGRPRRPTRRPRRPRRRFPRRRVPRRRINRRRSFPRRRIVFRRGRLSNLYPVSPRTDFQFI